jgi:DNA polymerase III epsilon subunit family exonuclease
VDGGIPDGLRAPTARCAQLAIRELESSALPQGMRRRLGALRAEGEPLALAELARRLLALDGPPASTVARRLVAGLLGARPEALPERLAPDELRPIEESEVAATPLAQARFAVVDLETTGLSSARDAIIEIGAVRVEQLVATSRFETLVRPPGPGPLSAAIIALTGIDDALLAPAPPAHRALARFARWLDEARGAPWVAHTARFDSGFLRRAFAGQGAPAPAVAVLCTQRLARRLLPRLGRYDLDHVCAQFGVDNRARHRALGDADATARVWIELLALAIARGIGTVGELLDLQEQPTRRRRRSR